jgi:probable HAF family extracellular repeat protein
MKHWGTKWVEGADKRVGIGVAGNRCVVAVPDLAGHAGRRRERGSWRFRRRRRGGRRGYQRRRGWTRAFRWTASGGMQDLGTLGSGYSAAYGVSAEGSVVVGVSDGYAFRWTAAGGMQDLGTLGGWESGGLWCFRRWHRGGRLGSKRRRG